MTKARGAPRAFFLRGRAMRDAPMTKGPEGPFAMPGEAAFARQRTTAICSRLPPLYVYRVNAPFLMSPLLSKPMTPVTPL